MQDVQHQLVHVGLGDYAVAGQVVGWIGPEVGSQQVDVGRIDRPIHVHVASGPDHQAPRGRGSRLAANGGGDRVGARSGRSKYGGIGAVEVVVYTAQGADGSPAAPGN